MSRGNTEASAVSFWESSLSIDVDKIISKNEARDREDVVKSWLHDDRRMGLFSERLGNIMTNSKPRNTNKWAKDRFWR